ncbi:MAG: hypothetical protein MZW92_21025 [Comamonadaceae bacterium]|nr:hypothetical protein [Comamonadaceae bacterium]
MHAQNTCVSTSAWGSQMVNPAASVTLRTQATARQVTAWTITEWQNNTTHLPLNKPWDVATARFGNSFDKLSDRRRRPDDAAARHEIPRQDPGCIEQRQRFRAHAARRAAEREAARPATATARRAACSPEP